MAEMPANVRRFVILLLIGWAAFAGWSAVTDGVWMRWLLVLFLVGCVSYLRRSGDPAAATILPPAAMVLSFGLDALHAEDLVMATVCLAAFLGLLGLVVRRGPPDQE
jgi:hypothetical protein